MVLYILFLSELFSVTLFSFPDFSIYDVRQSKHLFIQNTHLLFEKSANERRTVFNHHFYYTTSTQYLHTIFIKLQTKYTSFNDHSIQLFIIFFKKKKKMKKKSILVK